MKKNLLIILFFFVSCCTTTSLVEVSDDFLMDLASENYRLGGGLFLDEFEEDLSPLSYKYYINYVEQHQAPSAENLAIKIKAANEYYFLSLNDGFIITLLYKDQNKIIGDDSRSALIDTVIFSGVVRSEDLRAISSSLAEKNDN